MTPKKWTLICLKSNSTLFQTWIVKAIKKKEIKKFKEISQHSRIVKSIVPSICRWISSTEGAIAIVVAEGKELKEALMLHLAFTSRIWWSTLHLKIQMKMTVCIHRLVTIVLRGLLCFLMSNSRWYKTLTLSWPLLPGRGWLLIRERRIFHLMI